jgi:hypothetical protein
MGVITVAAGILLAYGVLLVFAAMYVLLLLLLVLMLGGACVSLFGCLVAADGAQGLGVALFVAGAIWNVGLAWVLERLGIWPRYGLSKLGSGTNVRRWVVDLRGHDHDETHGDLSRRHDLDRASGADQEQAAR